MRSSISHNLHRLLRSRPAGNPGGSIAADTQEPGESIAADPNPVRGDAFGRASVTLHWEAVGSGSVEVHVGQPDGPLFARTDGSGSQQTEHWVTDGTVFFLTGPSDAPGEVSNATLATVRIEVLPPNQSVGQIPYRDELRTLLDEPILRELGAWAEADARPLVWLRDDDATSDIHALRRLLEMCRRLDVRPAIAVIPADADPSLTALLAEFNVVIWQHGWRHVRHENGEFGDGRSLSLMVDDAIAGGDGLDGLFGPSGWQRVFVPPFHALSLAFKEKIPSLGYVGLSAGDPLTPPVAGLPEVDADIDILNWQIGAPYPPEQLAAITVAQLQARRLGSVDRRLPLGILTHHKQFDDEAWTITSRLLEVLRGHPVVDFPGADGLFQQPRITAPTSAVDSEVSMVVTSCGRQDLLVRTLDSFLAFNTHPIREVVIVEDGPQTRNQPLEARYRQHGFKWLATGTQVGQMAAVDLAYANVSGDYIFHCEDDWEFYSPSFIEKSLAVLRSNAGILQVWLRPLDDTNAHPLMAALLFAGEVPYRLLQPNAQIGEHGTWHGFSFNPGLRRSRDYLALGSFGALDATGQMASDQVERLAATFYFERGLLAAILADNEGRGYVRHTGGSRQVPKVLVT
ncbi:MAG: glycosyltransferase [Candidatus Limnocylindrales bacterium]